MNELASQALVSLQCEPDAWQIADIKAAIKDANRGEFATKREVEAFFEEYARKSD